MSKLKIGLSNFHYAILVRDDDTGFLYKKPVHVPNIVTATLEKTTNTAKFFADNKPIEVANTFAGTKVTIEMADVPMKDQAALLGHTYEDGILKRNANDKAPYVAILFESKLADGTIQYLKAFKGMFHIPKGEYATEKDSPEFKSTTLEAEFIVRAYDSADDWIAYSDEMSQAAIDNWFEYVVDSATTVVDTATPAPANLSVSPTELELNTENTYSGTVNVTRDGNGTISANSNNEAVSYSISNTTITVTGNSVGLTDDISATLTVNVAADGTSYASDTTTVSVTVKKAE